MLRCICGPGCVSLPLFISSTHDSIHLKGLVSTNEQRFSLLFMGASEVLLLYTHFVT